MSDPVQPVINASTRLCAVYGFPIRHSASPAKHNAAFANPELCENLEAEGFDHDNRLPANGIIPTSRGRLIPRAVLCITV
jgi:hypothetical protein